MMCTSFRVYNVYVCLGFLIKEQSYKFENFIQSYLRAHRRNLLKLHINVQHVLKTPSRGF